MNEHPGQNTQGSRSKNRYPVTAPGNRMQLKGEIYFDTDAVIEQMGISRKTLERYRKQRGLVCSHFGNRRYFSETELLRFFKKHEEPKGRR